MILVVDSGSSKSYGVVIHEGKVIQELKGPGINPFITNQSRISEIIEDDFFLKTKSLPINTIYFYGAGCSTLKNKQLISDSFSRHFTFVENIIVDHDLMAAARAACGKNSGIAIILGTGSNSCLFDGTQITDHVLSLGFILGDEGSGSAIGKKWLIHFLYETAPIELMDAFKLENNESVEEIFHKVYQSNTANAYLGSHTKFLLNHIQHPFVNELVKGCFQDFFENHILKYTNVQQHVINAIGSVAFVFQNQLKEVAKINGCKIGKVIQDPIDGLISYHQQ